MSDDVEEKCKTLDIRDLSWADQYKLMGGLVYPRPIGLVSTLGPGGPNAAPFSFFNAIAVDPPMLMFSIGPKAGAIKDTLENIRQCPEFVVHLVSDKIGAQMNMCASDHPAHINEMDLAGFTSVPSEIVKPPRIVDAPVAFECKLERIVELGKTPYYLVIGEAVLIHAHAGVISDRYHVDADKLDLIGRIAGAGVYARTRDRFVMQIPPV